MAGATTNFAIPYPSSTDYVTDGATAMRSLADQVDAAMFAEVANRNLLINGAMQISQRSAVGTAVTGITATGYYTADRWNTFISSLGTWSQTTIADAPTGSGFRNSLKMACTTADASPAVSDVLILQQRFEGQNLQAIRKGTSSAQTLTVSFWVKSFQTGVFICEIEDVDNTRSVSKSYTITASNTWQYVSLVFPADTTGTFDNNPDASMYVNWWLGAGTNFTSGTLATTWGASVNANRAVGQTNVASSTSNAWQITGAQLTIGSAVVPFQFKSFADDLRDCQRYYYRRSQIGGYNYVEGLGAGVNFNNGIGIPFQNPVVMRAAPVFSVVSGNSGLDNYGSASAITYSSQQTSTIGGRLTFSTSGLSNYVSFFYIGNPDVTVQFLAEL